MEFGEIFNKEVNLESIILVHAEIRSEERKDSNCSNPGLKDIHIYIFIDIPN